jgi:hypothetical protein
MFDYKPYHMKLQLLLFLLSLGFTFCYGQSTEKISIPVLKESKKIDQLMDIVLNPKNAGKSEGVENSANNCFMIDFLKDGNNNFSIEIDKTTKPITNILINGMEIEKDHVGYFQYRQYKIFVWADQGFYDFFNKTSVTKTFDFVYKLQNPEPLGNEYSLATWHYQYRNGKLVEGPPRVMQLEKN